MHLQIHYAVITNSFGKLARHTSFRKKNCNDIPAEMSNTVNITHLALTNETFKKQGN